MEKIVKIEEVTGIKLVDIGTRTDKVSLVMNQMLGPLMGCVEYDGYKITTSEHEYNILIANGQYCFESWGYFSSDDDFDGFIGNGLVDVELTDKALNNIKVEESGYYIGDDGGIQFVNFKMDNGSVLQFAVYNSHNGYYGHPIIIAKDDDIILHETL